MELNFSELDNTNIQNPEKYWEQTEEKPQQKYKKKKVSFDDILSNMNLVVNGAGVLQFMASKQPQPEPEKQYQQQQYQPQQYQPQQQYQQQQYQQQQYQPQQYDYYMQQYQQQKSHNNNKVEQVIKQPAINDVPIDPSVKHSYIYNKYFKDYQDVTGNNEPIVRVPKTMEEYRQMLLEDKIKQIEKIKRINEIKSTKLMFTSNEDASLNRKNIQPTKNNLRKMSFW
jgi:hypothetical protein